MCREVGASTRRARTGQVVRASDRRLVDRLREPGVMLRSGDIPRSERSEPLACVQAS
jgi:hypothetical protein